MEAILFIGIPAVGKSTFYQERFFTNHVRINLDMLKTRVRELLILQACLRGKQPFIVDNTNTLKRERARYLELAKPAGFPVVGYYFLSRLQEALARNRLRTGQAHISKKGILAKYSQLEVPSLAEGFDQLFYAAIDPTTSQFIVKEWQDEVR
jgi:predicted kinase